MNIEERAIIQEFNHMLKRIPKNIQPEDERFIRVTTQNILTALLDAEQPYNDTETFHEFIHSVLEQFKQFIAQRHNEKWSEHTDIKPIGEIMMPTQREKQLKNEKITSAEFERMTDKPVLDALQVESILRERNLKLYAYKSDNRYICRTVDSDNHQVSLSSGSSLPNAVSIAVLNI